MIRVRHLAAVAALSLSWGCSARAPAPAPVSEPTPLQAALPEPPPRSETITALDASSPPAPAPELAFVLDFQRLSEAKVHSLALGKQRAAALGAEAWLDEGKGFVRMPQPPAATEHVSIYFGRDDRPRLMGFDASAGQEKDVYFRWRGGGWQRARDEIGRLGGGPPAALFGVLGYDDPEVVCKVSDVCLIKSRSGWNTIPAPPGRPEVVLADGRALAYQADKLWQLGKQGFEPVGGASAFKRASAAWPGPGATLWVVEREANAIHYFDGHAWTRSESPISGPRALFAANADELWLVGDGGAAHRDARGWKRVKGVDGPLAAVTGRGAGEIWVGGDSGVWRGKRR